MPDADPVLVQDLPESEFTCDAISFRLDQFFDSTLNESYGPGVTVRQCEDRREYYEVEHVIPVSDERIFWTDHPSHVRSFIRLELDVIYNVDYTEQHTDSGIVARFVRIWSFNELEGDDGIEEEVDGDIILD